MNVLAYHLLLDAVTDVKFPVVSRVRRRMANMPKMPVALVTSVPEKGWSGGGEGEHPLQSFFAFLFSKSAGCEGATPTEVI